MNTLTIIICCGKQRMLDTHLSFVQKIAFTNHNKQDSVQAQLVEDALYIQNRMTIVKVCTMIDT